MSMQNGRLARADPHRAVGELGLTRPAEIRPSDTLQDAARSMRERDVSWVVVEGNPPGIVSERDLTRAVAQGAVPAEPVSVVATRRAVTVGTMTPLGRAAALMARDGIRHLPVLNADGRVVGVLSARDVLRMLLAQPEWSEWVAEFDGVAADGG